jgi:hypothetical protein
MTKEIYQIRVKGYLDPERSSWFDGLVITHTTGGETLLTGLIVDQAALHGVLIKIRDLGLSLLEVKRSDSAVEDGQANFGNESGRKQSS